MATPGPINPDAVIAQVKRLINAQLKAVLKQCNLPVSGAKAALQQRIITQVNTLASINDADAFNRLRYAVFHPEQDSYNYSTASSPAPRSFQTDSGPLQTSYQQPYSAGQVRPMMPAPSGATAPRTPVFKSSPFYSILQPLTPVLEIKVREQTRDNVQAIINLRDDNVARLAQDPTIRAMVFCASDSMNSPFQRVDITFPYQVEIRVNQDEVKANLRGLKNKPGSTRPADITTYLRKRAGYENHLQVTYALTTKKYFLIVNLVRQQPVTELVSRLKATNRKILKERVISEMKSRADDSDIVATSSILSLKCPLSTLRIDVPCRSTLCAHNQCFDASSFLQLQEQAPTWTCPICNKAVTFEILEVDQYVEEILESTPKSVDQVTIEPDGKWSRSSTDTRSPRTSNGAHGASSDDDDEDDDLVEIKDGPQLNGIKNEAVSENLLLRTPPVSSRGDSAASIPPASSSSGNKRPASQVVDLTLSSDDEEPIRAPKRPAIQRVPSCSSLPAGSKDLPHGPNGSVGDLSTSPPISRTPAPAVQYESRVYNGAY